MKQTTRRVFLGCAALLCVLASSARTQNSALYDYYRDEASRLVDTPGTSRSVAAGRLNPASWPIQRRGGAYFAWQTFEDDGSIDDLTGVISLRNLGFGVRSVDRGDFSWTDYSIGIGGGSRARSWGLGYAWDTGDPVFGSPGKRITSGSIWRHRLFSVGLGSMYGLDDEETIDQIDLGLRPFGPRYTLFAEAIGYRSNADLISFDYDESSFGYGLRAQPIPGIGLALRADDEGRVGVQLSVAWDRVRVGGFQQLDDDQETFARAVQVEVGEGPSLRDLFPQGGRYPEIHLKGDKPYRKYEWFDDRETFLNLLARINRYAEDPEVDGVLVNMSGVRMSVANMWELRTQLAGLRAWGKKVLIYVDRLSIPSYALASVADELWIDPQGSIDMAGLNFGRSYYKEMLAKANIGFDEWRFFRYKSAAESFSRTSFSEGAQEQLQALLDSFWDDALQLISDSRGMPRAKIEDAVNTRGRLLPREAEELGFVDHVGDFHEMRDAKNGAVRRPGPDRVATPLGPVFGDPVWRGEEWGEAPLIAVLYAIGPCDMDSGIRGRQLSKLIRKMRENDRVKAIVLRVDSPGGDPLPSDLVARELRETSRVKPVIVSQGQVAGSGGYWISMDGDTIVASPFTVTGSVGVIAGHVYDDGISDRLGIDYDHVQKGRSADMYAGPSLPFVGISIPHRPVTEEERERAKSLILELYDDFVNAVAEGRGLTEEKVREIAQGRIYSGTDGLEIGLVDEINGLWGAVILAKQAAGLREDARVAITQGPGIGKFPNFFSPSLIGTRLAGLLSEPAPVQAAVAVADPLSSLELRPSVLTDVVSQEQWQQLSVGTRSYLVHLLTRPGEAAVMMEPLEMSGFDVR